VLGFFCFLYEFYDIPFFKGV